jgi:hypothetical protein
MQLKSLLYILLIFAASCVKAQTFAIHGTVSDDKGVAIPGATVFITNTSHAMATNDAGRFSFNKISPGNYEVVIKMIGFDPVIQSVTVNQRSINIIARLTESITQLKAVTIKGGHDPNRATYMLQFTNNFIGETVNAQQCKILNPDVLHFRFDKQTGTLYASADELLVVENKALGYTLKFLLTEFKFNLQQHTCLTEGYPYFEELTGTEEQRKKWDEKRWTAYISSERPFFKAWANNTLKQEGYIVYLVTDHIIYNDDLKYRSYTMRETKSSEKMVSYISLADAGDIFIKDHGNYKTIIPGPHIVKDKTVEIDPCADTISLRGIYVLYTGEKESPLFYKTGEPIPVLPFINLTPIQKRNRQISVLLLSADTIIIDKNGQLTPTRSFKLANYWAWLRKADLTPLDYIIEPEKQTGKLENNTEDTVIAN